MAAARTHRRDRRDTLAHGEKLLDARGGARVRRRDARVALRIKLLRAGAALIDADGLPAHHRHLQRGRLARRGEREVLWAVGAGGATAGRAELLHVLVEVAVRAPAVVRAWAHAQHDFGLQQR